jgi:hypothetical protein
MTTNATERVNYCDNWLVEIRQSLVNMGGVLMPLNRVQAAELDNLIGQLQTYREAACVTEYLLPECPDCATGYGVWLPYPAPTDEKEKSTDCSPPGETLCRGIWPHG